MLVLLLVSLMGAQPPIDTVIVHHSATATGTVESIRAYHITHNGWIDIGYHWLIYRDGSIHAGRPETVQGAHAKGRNAGSLGVCLIGEATFTPEQVSALRALLADLRKRHPTITKIERHHAKCPGAGLDLERVVRS
jgi:N-acetylmuramoyl-L-alanine amidase